MKHLIFVLVAVWGIFQVAGLIGLSKGQFQAHSLAQLAEPPSHHLTEPYHNAYFYLLGFAASASLDPAKVGYETWVEAHETSDGNAFAYDKPGRSDLRIRLSPRQALPSWDADDPLGTFRSKDASLRTTVAGHQVLLARYDHCIGMPFEDWGFGHRATPRYEDSMVAHRLYIADGFSRSTNLGLERLYKELVFWRTVLREAATIETKVMAQIVIQDDAKLLSRIVSRPIVDKSVLGAALQLMVPLTPSEYALRWPIQHQLAVAGQDERARTAHPRESAVGSDHEQEWLLATAHLPPGSFRRIEHPISYSILGFPLNSQQTADMYATYYETLIKASGAGAGPLPKLRQISGSMRRGFLESVVNQEPIEPEWEMFLYQLMETDARLRLTSLQIQLRRPSPVTAVPTRLAEVGSQYFDPFTGLPMLWSPTQQKLYSVGKDRLDDGGDPSFDITVPAVIASSQKYSDSSPSAAAASTRKVSRL